MIGVLSLNQIHPPFVIVECSPVISVQGTFYRSLCFDCKRFHSAFTFLLSSFAQHFLPQETIKPFWRNSLQCQYRHNREKLTSCPSIIAFNSGKMVLMLL